MSKNNKTKNVVNNINTGAAASANASGTVNNTNKLKNDKSKNRLFFSRKTIKDRVEFIQNSSFLDIDNSLVDKIMQTRKYNNFNISKNGVSPENLIFNFKSNEEINMFFKEVFKFYTFDGSLAKIDNNMFNNMIKNTNHKRTIGSNIYNPFIKNRTSFLNTKNKNYMAIDIETTGLLKNAGQSITEIGISGGKNGIKYDSILVGLKSNVSEQIKNIIEKYELGESLTENEIITLERMTKYAKSNGAVYSEKNGMIFVNKISDKKLTDFASRSEAANMAREGLAILSGEYNDTKFSKFNKLVKNNYDEHLSLISDYIQSNIDNKTYFLTQNGTIFDLPILKRYFGDNFIDETKHIDLLEIIRSRYGNDLIEINNAIKNSTSLDLGLKNLRLEDIAIALTNNGIIEEGISHMAGYDAYVTRMFASLQTNNNKDFVHNIVKGFTYDTTSLRTTNFVNKNNVENVIEKGLPYELFNTGGLKLTENDMFFVVSNRDPIYDIYNFKYAKNQTYLNAKTRYNIVGLYDTSKQLETVHDSIKTMAKHNDFYTMVLQDSFGNLVFINRKREEELYEMLKNFIAYNANDEKTYKKFRTEEIYNELDKARRRLIGYTDINDSTRNITELKKMYELAKSYDVIYKEMYTVFKDDAYIRNNIDVFNPLFHLEYKLGKENLKPELIEAEKTIKSILYNKNGDFNYSLYRDFISLYDEVYSKEYQDMLPILNNIIKHYELDKDAYNAENIAKAKIAFNNVLQEYYGGNRFKTKTVQSYFKKANVYIDLKMLPSDLREFLIDEMIRNDNIKEDINKLLYKIDISNPDKAARSLVSKLNSLFDKTSIGNNSRNAEMLDSFKKNRTLDIINSLVNNYKLEIDDKITQIDPMYALSTVFRQILKERKYEQEKTSFDIITGVYKPKVKTNSIDINKHIQAAESFKIVSASNKDEMIKHLKKSDFAKMFGDDAAEELSDVLYSINRHLKENGAELSFELIKSGKNEDKKFWLKLSALKTSEDVSKNKVIGKSAIIDLGRIKNYYGIDVIEKSGYRQINSRFINLDKFVNNKFDNINDITIVSGYTKALSDVKEVSRIIANSLFFDDTETAEKMFNKRIDRTLSKLTRLESNVHAGELPKIKDFINSRTIYTEDFIPFVLASGVNFKSLQNKEYFDLNKIINNVANNLSESMTQIRGESSETLLNKRILDIGDVQFIIKAMLENEDDLKPGSFAYELYKFAKANNMQHDELVNYIFAGHEQNSGKNMSIYLENPSEYSVFGFTTKASRPITRQRLNAYLYNYDNIDAKINRSILTTEKELNALKNASAASGKNLESTFTGEILLMSQKELDEVVDQIIKENNISKESILYKELRSLNVTNQESIVNNIFSSMQKTYTKEYNIDKYAIVNKNIIDEINKNGYAKVTKGKLIGQVKKSSGLENIYADFDGILRKTNNGFVLEKELTSKNTIKTYIAGSEKSASKIISKEATELLEQKLGKFSIIANLDLKKHEAYDVPLQDTFNRLYYHYKNIYSNEQALEKTAQAINYVFNDEIAKVSDNKIVLKGKASVNADLSKLAEIDKQIHRNKNDALWNRRYLLNINFASTDSEIVDPKGGKFNLRLIESMYRFRDENNNVIGKRFLDALVGETNEISAHKIKRKKLARDYQKYINAINYIEGKEIKGSIQDIDDITNIGIFRNKILEYENLSSHSGKLIFGNSGNYIRVKLEKSVEDVGIFNKNTVNEIVLPNTYVFGAGDKDFFTSNYQKGVINFVRMTQDIKDYKEGKKSLKMLGYKTEKELYAAYDESVRNIYKQMKTDMVSKDGMLDNISSVRIKNSKMLLNKELFKANDIFTAGASGLQDIAYITRNEAMSILNVSKEEYEKKYKHLLERSAVEQRLGKVSNEIIEENWGMMGLVNRYPSIMRNSAMVAKIRVIEDGVLDNGQVAIFSHSSVKTNADVDTDKLLVAIFDHTKIKNDKLSNKIRKDFEKRLKAQESENKVYRMFLESEYEKIYGFVDKNVKDKTTVELFNELAKKDKSVERVFSNKFTKEGYQSILESGFAKVKIGKANIPSFVLRQASSIAVDKGLINVDQMNMVHAFTEIAEQKMIDSIKTISSQEDIITQYNKAVMGFIRNGNSKETIGKFIKSLSESNMSYFEEAAKRYLITKGNVEEAKQFIDNAEYRQKFIQNYISELIYTTEKTMRETRNIIKKELGAINLSSDINDEQLAKIIDGQVAKIHDKNSFNKKFLKDIGLKTKKENAKIKYTIKNNKEGTTKQSAAEKAKAIEDSLENKIKNEIVKNKSSLNKKTVLKSVGIGVAAALIASAIVRPNPVGSRAMDDVGLVSEDDDSIQIEPVYSQIGGSTPVIYNNKNGYQINIDATSYNHFSKSDLQKLMSSSFGGQVNVRIMSYNKQHINPFAIDEMLSSSIY